MKSSYSNWHCTHTYYAREMCRAILIGHCSARLANHTDLIEWLHWILWNLMNKFILRLLNFLLHLQDMSMMPNFDLCKAHAVLNTSGTDIMSFGKTPIPLNCLCKFCRQNVHCFPVNIICWSWQQYFFLLDVNIW